MLSSPPLQKPRLPSLDSIRFFLISYIATGHFVNFGTTDIFVLKFFGQINVVVGAFFVLSGEEKEESGWGFEAVSRIEVGTGVETVFRITI